MLLTNVLVPMYKEEDKKTAGIAINAYGEFPLILSEEMLYMLYRSGEFQRIIREQKGL